MHTENALNTLQEELGYHFNNEKLLIRALTHRSMSSDNYERLEFLGDAVLSLIISQELFLKDKNFNEGSLSRVRSNLVCEKTLSQLASKLCLSQYIYFGVGEIKSGGRERPSILADVLEAIFAAIMLDSDFETARKVVLNVFHPLMNHLSPDVLSKDYKTQLQEYLQSLRIDLPQYVIVSSTGEAHNQLFTCRCVIKEKNISTTGCGKSHRLAEQNAAHVALMELGVLNK